HPVDPAARRHPRERGSAARLQPRRADHHLRPADRPGPRLHRRCAAAQRRRGRADDPDREEGAVHETVRTEGGMSLFRFLKPVSSAPVARERLQILLEYERRMVNQTSLITTLKEEILAVVSRHVSIDPERIHVSVDRGEGFSTLAVGVQIPNHRNSMTEELI